MTMQFVTTREDRGDPVPADALLFREMQERWPAETARALPMTATAYATEIMEDMHKAGARVPLQTKQGYTMQSTIATIVQQAMDKAVESYREARWWRRMERKLTGREWP